MPIPFKCSQCGTPHNAPDHLAGKKIKCKGCGSAEQVPAAGAVSGSPPSQLSSQKPASQPAAKPATPSRAAPAIKKPATAEAPQAAVTTIGRQPANRTAEPREPGVVQPAMAQPQAMPAAMPNAFANDPFANVSLPGAALH